MAILKQINERATAVLSATLEDAAGVAVSWATVTSAKLSITVATTAAVVNTRDRVLVWDDGAATVDSPLDGETDGTFTLTLSSTDNQMVGGGSSEVHEITLDIVWPDGRLPWAGRVGIIGLVMVP